MHARLSRFAGLPPERIDQTLDEFRDQQLPEIEQHDGYQGVVVMVNRRTGQAAAITYWASDAAMRASERAAGQAVQAALERGQPSREPVIDRYEVVYQK
jgi:heme-degrading monooxygenase HmoA